MKPIIWDVDPEIFSIGSFSLRYYSVLFAGGLLLGYQVVKKMFREDKRNLEDLDRLTLFIFIGTVFGARLGHCLFYEPEYYLSHPLEMILPFTWGEDGFEFTGFLGLASHGGITGVFLAIWYFCRKYKYSMLDILDKVSVAGALAGMCIRLGNFFNSEIIGKATGGDWGVVFKRVDDIPRHPGQLYEAIAYFLIFILLRKLYYTPGIREKKGFLFGLFFTLLFVARFLIEYVKENQVAFEDGLAINMGQILSIPFILVGIGVMFWSRQRASDKLR